MIPMLFAAAVAVADPAPPAAAAPHTTIFMIKPGQNGSFMKPEFKDGVPVLCDRSATKTAGPDHAPLKKLGELPPGLMEHAVLRMVNGCPVREIVFAGRTYYLDAPTGGLERLDPAAWTPGKR